MCYWLYEHSGRVKRKRVAKYFLFAGLFLVAKNNRPALIIGPFSIFGHLRPVAKQSAKVSFRIVFVFYVTLKIYPSRRSTTDKKKILRSISIFTYIVNLFVCLCSPVSRSATFAEKMRKKRKTKIKTRKRTTINVVTLFYHTGNLYGHTHKIGYITQKLYF